MLLLFLISCEPEVVDSAYIVADDVIDLRAIYPDPPEGGLQILTPDLAIPPYSEILWCYYDSWKGPDMGMTSFVELHPVQFHHHSLVKDANSLDSVSDGQFADCTDIEEEDGMQIPPLLHTVSMDYPQGEGSIVRMPPDMAFRLETGQKYSADIHYINPTDKTVIINSAFNIGLVPADDVQDWVSSFDLDAGYFELPPNQESSIAFDCELEADVSIVTLLAHAHQYGKRYKVELIDTQGGSRVLMDIEWREQYRWSSPTFFFRHNEFILSEGDKIRTTCTWDNPTGDILMFPAEMCTTSGVGVGLSKPVFCTGDPVDLGTE